MPKSFEETCAEMRVGHEKMRPIFAARPVTGERFAVPREGADAVDVILYRPAPSDTPAPVLLDMHGGGFIGGDAVLMDSFCRLICDTLGMFVVNVNYRKAPEYPFPYAIVEVADTAAYFAAHADEFRVDPAHIFVAGHSAGAALAIGAALKCRDDGVPLAGQILVYPCTKMGAKPGDPDDNEEMRTYTSLYCQHGDHAHLWASPLWAKDEELAGVCPAVFVTCEKDFLREQGEAYAKRLVDVGVPVAVRRFPNALHGFVEVNRPDYFFEDERKSPEQAALAREAERWIIAQLRTLL